MPKNPFTHQPSAVGKPNRNVFDLTKRVNTSFKIGQLIPVLCQEVIPGDTFKVKPSFGFRLNPLQFPVQTDMYVSFQLYMVRNRVMYKDWMDLIGKTKDVGTNAGQIQMPWIKTSDPHRFSTSSLADYLGVPSTIAENTPTYQHYYPVSYEQFNAGVVPIVADSLNDQYPPSQGYAANVTYNATRYPTFYSADGSLFFDRPLSKFLVPAQQFQAGITKYTFFVYNLARDLADVTDIMVTNDGSYSLQCYFGKYSNGVVEKIYPPRRKGSVSDAVLNASTNFIMNFNYGHIMNLDEFLAAYRQYSSSLSLNDGLVLVVCDESGEIVPANNEGAGWSGELRFFTTHDVISEPINNNPFVTAEDTGVPEIPLSALPFRAYEMVYNAYFRDPQVDPFRINGVPEYNKFIPSDEGGPDSYEYQIHNVNYEKDFLTSAMTSPQQGNAPLVGISIASSTQSRLSFNIAAEGEPEDLADAILSQDADGRLTSIDSVDGRIPLETKRLLQDAVSQGISINDFRNVNAFQRWLETNIRRGYRYKEQIKSHYGIDVRYDELDMPEFIGGITRRVSVQELMAQDGANLGDFSGYAGIFGSSDHTMSHYCDEHGILLGVVYVRPVPVYSQLLPKLFTKDHPFDFYFPEFAHIGYQPITYREVTPLQAHYTGVDIDSVFGYQRAWYDYLQNVDEAHGDFRTSRANFLMQRTFLNPPVLGREFIQVHPEDISDVFKVTDPNYDMVYGQIAFDIEAIRPISRFGIPRLE